jgi:YVTN family beta-propeller protein
VPGDEGWDYINFDSRSRRLFISRSTRVVVVDVDTDKVVGEIANTAGVHGIALDPKDDRGFTSNGRANTVTIFDLKTLKTIGTVPVGEGPDAILFDPATDRVFTFNGRAHSATAIDAAKGAVVGTVELPGKPEFGATDGRGHLYNNIEDRSEVVQINAKTLKVEHTWPIAPGESPSGIAVDGAGRRVFSVCDNGKMVVLDADSGAVVATPAVGNGPDATAFDPGLKIAFSPNGEDGTLTLVHEDSHDKYTPVATVKTASGARTMALDPATHQVFLVTATAAPAPAEAAGGQRRRRAYAPGSFVVLVYAP